MTDSSPSSPIRIATPPGVKVGSYPKPYVVQPLSGKHKQTFIVLHGRGDSAQNFGPPFLAWPVPNHTNMRKAFPDTKYIFPGAAFRHAALNNMSISSQWFDSGHPGLQQGKLYDDLQIEGLRESTKFLHQLMAHAIGEVGAGNVVVGGLSQGGATSMAAMLLWPGEPIAAWFGLCTRVPFCNRIGEALNIHSLTEKKVGEMKIDTDPTQRFEQARKWLARELAMEDYLANAAQGKQSHTSPIFFGHGVLDTLVPMKLGQDTTVVFRSLGLQVSWNEYRNLEHWYSDEMLRDLIDFLSPHIQCK